MAYCCQCGFEVADTAAFCRQCGAKQPASTGGRPADFLRDVSPRAAATACYIPFVGWIASIAVLAADRFRTDREVRFHAFQGLYIFVAWLIVDWVLSDIFRFTWSPKFVVSGLKAVVLGAWIFMLIKVSQNQMFRLPVLGELAERSVAEQR
jgi:uncharacterized membrane protein